MSILKDNERCTTIDLDFQICKKYYNDHSFNNEMSVYTKMKGKPYIPKLVKIDKVKKNIFIEKLTLPNLKDYIDSNKKIPYYLLKSLRKIRLDFCDKGFYDHGDFFKWEHIYIDEGNYSNNKVGIKIIDFDYCERYHTTFLDDYKKQIIEEFDKLNKDRNKFQDKFQEYRQAIINDFFKNKVLLD